MPEDLQHRILAMVSLTVVARLGATSKKNSTLSKAHANRRVHGHLSSFDVPPNPFLNALRESNSVMSGSVGLAVVGDQRFPCADLDEYCPRGSLEVMEQFLLNHTGYRLDAVAGCRKPYQEYTVGRIGESGQFRSSLYSISSNCCARDPRGQVLRQHGPRPGHQPHRNLPSLCAHRHSALSLDVRHELHHLERDSLFVSPYD